MAGHSHIDQASLGSWKVRKITIKIFLVLEILELFRTAEVTPLMLHFNLLDVCILCWVGEDVILVTSYQIRSRAGRIDGVRR